MPEQEEERLVDPIQLLIKEIGELRAKIDAPDSGLLERVTILEDQQGAPELPSLAGSGPSYETPAIITDFIDESDEQEPVIEELMPFDIEFGKPTTNITADSATVTLQPCAASKANFSNADTVTVYVSCDRSSQSLTGKEWRKATYGIIMQGQPVFGDPESTVTVDGTPFTEAMVGQFLTFLDSGNSYLIEAYTAANIVDVTGDASSELADDDLVVEGNILSFIRFSPWVAGSPNVEGVLIGCGGDSIPSGVIVKFEGFGSNIPLGWTLCDGGNDSKSVATPDLSGMFIVGYSSSDSDYDAIAKTGGFKLHGPTENEHAVRQMLTSTAPGVIDSYTPKNDSAVDVDTDNRAPYYTLAFIRKD